MNQISSEVIGSILRDSNGDYLHTQMPGNSYHEYSDPVKLVVTVGADENGVDKYLINGDLYPELSFEFGRTYEFDLSAVPANHPFILSTTEGGLLIQAQHYMVVKLQLTLHQVRLIFTITVVLIIHLMEWGMRFLLYHLVCLQT